MNDVFLVRIDRKSREVWKVRAANEGQACNKARERAGERLDYEGFEAEVSASQITAENRMTVCQDCQAVYAEKDLEEPKDLWQRVNPGETVPAGQCPDCGALCHLLDP